MHRFSTDDEFFVNWRAVLQERVNEVVYTFANVDGVYGLILGGSLGRNEPWALSDIDIIPIYENETEQARSLIAEKRQEILEQWENEGWRTALDVGTLAFTEEEVLVGLRSTCPLDLLVDDRWFHSLDKGYQSKAVYDPTGLATKLAEWFTTNRFKPDIVEFRLNQHRIVTEHHSQDLRSEIEKNNLLKANQTLNNGVSALKTYLLEKWGKRDNSFARIGTRFERIANIHGKANLLEILNDLSNMKDEQVLERISHAPDWIQKRHKHSWQARKLIGEEVTKIQDARDVLRVFSRYELMKQSNGHFPAWLAVDTDLKSLNRKSVRFMQVLSEVFS